MTLTKLSADLTIAARLAFALMVVLLASLIQSAHAAGVAVEKASQQCLGCHAMKGMEKKLANGETLELHVDAAAFAKSAHSVLGCAVCHSDTTTDNHPPVKRNIAGVREYSLERQKVCSTCHADKFKLYEGSIHASLLRDGNPVAPVCTDCHSPHNVVPKASYEVATGAPCSKCHSSIFEAYADSVHGKAQKQGRIGAPACANCHSAHDVKPAAGEEKLRYACFGCHAGALSAHQKWLPNAELHLKTVSCPACHAPGAKRRVDLRLYDIASQKRFTDKEGVPQFETRARAVDAQSKGLDAPELQRLLKELNADAASGKSMLRGRLEVDDGVEAHKLASKAQAVTQCETCHQAGSAAFQKVSISIAGPDGRPVRYDAHGEVLNSAVSVDSVRGFYVIGGTRIKVLDILVVLALLGGVSVPVVHLVFGWLSRKMAKRIGGREDS